MIHRYEWTHSGITEKEINWFTVNAVMTDEDFKQFLIDNFVEAAPAAFQQQWNEAYPDEPMTFIGVENISCQLLIRTVPNYFGAPDIYMKVQLTGTIVFEADKVLMNSPLEPLTAAILIKVVAIIVNAIVLAILGYFAIQAIADLIKSWTTKTTTIKKYCQDPNTGEWVVCGEETITEPDIGGMGTLGIFVLVGFLILLLFMFGLPRKKD